jgi:hypothetical protein
LIDPDHELYAYLHPLLNGQAFCSLPAARLKSFQKQFQQLMTAQLCLEQVKQLLMDVLLAQSSAIGGFAVGSTDSTRM